MLYTLIGLLLFISTVMIVGVGVKDTVGGLLGLTVIVGGYFLPTIIAAARKVPNGGSVLVVNLFLGWTLIGWVVALAMAARTVPQETVSSSGASG
jgi:Superinfection immunity protein